MTKANKIYATTKGGVSFEVKTFDLNTKNELIANGRRVGGELAADLTYSKDRKVLSSGATEASGSHKAAPAGSIPAPAPNKKPATKKKAS